MRILLAVKSCGQDRDKGYHRTIRDTWGKDVEKEGADLLFFVGADSHVNELDEVRVAALDEYHSLPWKTREIVRYTLSKAYDHIFLCDTDSFIIPRKLMKTGFENWDYFGINSKPLGITFSYTAPDRNRKQWRLAQCWPWMSGGIGYFLSRKAMEYVSVQEPTIWAEDLNIGQIMGPLYNEGKIKACNGEYEGKAAWHFPRSRVMREPFSEVMQAWMRDMYARHSNDS